MGSVNVPDPVNPDPANPDTQSGNSLSGLMKNGRLDPQTKSLGETVAAQTAVVTAGTDQLVTQTVPQAMQVTETGGGFSPIATIGGGALRLNTGSHVDSKMYGLSFGMAKTIAVGGESGGDTMTYGAAFSYGMGSYDSYLDNGMHGAGDTKQAGMNLFARRNNGDGVYYEGSVSFGKAYSDYKSDDLLIQGSKVHTSYDTQALYLGAHLGVGKLVKFENGASLDTFFRYLYSHTYGDNVLITADDITEEYTFEATNSHRFHLGTRYSLPNGIYVGATWQYEANGEAVTTYRGHAAPSPSLKGHTGIFDLGWKKENPNGWDVNVGLHGYLGVARGLTMSVGSTFHF